MSEYWIVVADASRARVFSRNKKFSPLEEVESLVHPESRLRSQDLVTDRPGQKQKARTTGEYEAGEGTDPKEVEAEVFARELAERLDKAHKSGSFEQLVLMAEPDVLGEMRKRLNDKTADALARTVAVNLTRESVERITRAADSALE